MKVKQSKISKITASELDNLNPVDIILEDVRDGAGKITITCFGKSWSGSWGAMGSRKVLDFVLGVGNDYLHSSMDPGTRARVPDFDGLSGQMRAKIVALRRAGELDMDKARDLYSEARWVTSPYSNEGLMYKIYGDEWWHDLPEVENPDYEYLERILVAVRAALTEVKKEAS